MCDKYMYLYYTSLQCSNYILCVYTCTLAYMYMYETCGHRHSNICDVYIKGSVYGDILCLRHTLYVLVVLKKTLDIELLSFNNLRN